ncbi:MAG: ERF family protein [Candidatus Saccharimonadales bacterium]
MADSKKNVYEALRAVQLELKAPKNQRNSFGNYNYRSCEDILEAVKPLLNTHDLTLVVTDKLQSIGDRYYVEAEATVTDGTDAVTAYGYAREEETKKGMDGAQITGASSSYARKYALNGLFLIDDTKDADSDEHRKAKTQTSKPVTKTVMDKVLNDLSKDEPRPVGLISDKQLAFMQANFTELKITERDEKLAYVVKIIGRKVESSTELTLGQAKKVIDKQLADKEDKDFNQEYLGEDKGGAN